MEFQDYKPYDKKSITILSDDRSCDRQHVPTREPAILSLELEKQHETRKNRFNIKVLLDRFV